MLQWRRTHCRLCVQALLLKPEVTKRCIQQQAGRHLTHSQLSMPKAGGADTNLHTEQQLQLCLTRRGVPVRAGAHGPELASGAARSTVGGQAPTLSAAGVAQGAEAIPAGRHACTQGAQQSESCSSCVLRSLRVWPQQSEAVHAERAACMQGRQPENGSTNMPRVCQGGPGDQFWT